jgi:ribonucleotide monophosphatase NagD (HAD superfamily)
MMISITPIVVMASLSSMADIRGANDASIQSILVHTGVYDPANGSPRYKPWREAADVLEAVTCAIEEEYCSILCSCGWHP